MSFRSNHLSITSWNIHGFSENFFLGNKLSTVDFLSCFKHSDIIVLTETWRSNDFYLPGFELFTSPSKKHHNKKNGTSSGGITFGFKIDLKQGIKLIASNPKFVWSKLDKTFFNLDQDIFLCAIYIPPRDSPYFNPDIFDEFQYDIAKYSTDGQNFNARTGYALDYVDIDHCVHILGDNLRPLPTLRQRKNFDSQINEHGQSLLEICKACDLRILNGRTTGDSFGKIT